MTTATSTDDRRRTVQVHRVYIPSPHSGCGTRC